MWGIYLDGEEGDVAEVFDKASNLPTVLIIVDPGTPLYLNLRHHTRSLQLRDWGYSTWIQPLLSTNVLMEVSVSQSMPGYITERRAPGSSYQLLMSWVWIYLLLQRLDKPLIPKEVTGHVHVSIIDQDPVLLQIQHNTCVTQLCIPSSNSHCDDSHLTSNSCAFLVGFGLFVATDQQGAYEGLKAKPINEGELLVILLVVYCFNVVVCSQTIADSSFIYWSLTSM